MEQLVREGDLGDRMKVLEEENILLRAALERASDPSVPGVDQDLRFEQDAELLTHSGPHYRPGRSRIALMSTPEPGFPPEPPERNPWWAPLALWLYGVWRKLLGARPGDD